jgi:hypothetical protein
MQPLPGSSGFQMERRERVRQPKTDFYDGIWREVVIIDVVAALVVLATGLLRSWDSFRDFALAYSYAGQALMVLGIVPVLIGVYLRWHGGHHDWQSPLPENWRDRPDLRARQQSMVMYVSAFFPFGVVGIVVRFLL